MVPTFAVVPSNGRPFLKDCVASLKNQVDRIVVVQNGEDINFFDEKMVVVLDSGSDLNISRWWNIGIEFAESMVNVKQWNILVVNDDVIAGHNLVETLSAEMRMSTAVLAYPNQFDNHRFLHREANPIDLHHRITGYCYMLRGESRMHIDERFVWWAGDDDLDWRCRLEGGSLLVPWCKVAHRAPNGTFLEHPELHEQASKDMQAFEEKWGRRPW